MRLVMTGRWPSRSPPSAAARPDLSRQAGPRHRALHAGQRHRRDGPRGGPGAVDATGPAGHGREPARRRRHDRRRPRSPRRRPTATRCWSTRRATPSIPRSIPTSPTTRPRTWSASACWPQQPNILVARAVQGLEDRRRPGEGGQGRAGQAHLRLGRHRQRHPHERREVPAARRHRRRARALQGHARGADRHHERPRRLSSSRP